jgi:hypothetical protein
MVPSFFQQFENPEKAQQTHVRISELFLNRISSIIVTGLLQMSDKTNESFQNSAASP